MTKTKRISALLMSLVLVFSVAFSTATSASAATASSGMKTQVIYVETKANWWIPGSESITLTQTKGTRTTTTYSFFTGKSSTKNTSCYGTWDVVAVATDGSHTVKGTLSGSSLKIKLKPNKAYQITVSWNSDKDMIASLSKGSFSKLPTWKVSSTYKVSYYK